MLDAGWRRSGNYLYRPDMAKTCCPAYVIRLDAMRYEPSVSHKRVLKRLRRFTSTDVEFSHCSSAVSAVNSKRIGRDHTRKCGEEVNVESCKWLVGLIEQAIDELMADGIGEGSFKLGAVDVKSVKCNVKVYPPRSSGKIRKKADRVERGGVKKEGGDGGAVDSGVEWMSNAAMLLSAAERKKAADIIAKQSGVMREKGKKLKLKDEYKKRQMEIADMLARCVNKLPSTGWVVTVSAPGFLNFFSEKEVMNRDSALQQSGNHEERAEACSVPTASMRAGLSGGEKMKPLQMSSSLLASSARLSRVGSDVSADKNSRAENDANLVVADLVPSSVGGKEFEGTPRHATQILEELSELDSFKIELVPAQFMPAAYEVFRKYQMIVHKETPDQCNEQAYRRFLVDSPLTHWHSAANIDEVYGSFHMLYKIRDRLMAVGVVDILPRCLSSVYLFYDPDFAKLSPGTLSALKEIEWIRKSAVIYPSLRFYYMGYYIHSCPKMRYKALYYPSELLCEVTRNWVPVSYAQSVLDVSTEQFTRLVPENVLPASEAENFVISEAEREVSINDSVVQVSVEGDGYQLFNFRVLNRLLLSRFPGEMDALRRKIYAFIGLVGKADSKFFVHVL